MRLSVAHLDPLPHPLSGGVAAIERALDGMPVEAWRGVEVAELRSLAERLMRLESRVRGQLMAATRALDETGAAKAAGAASTGTMLAKSFGATAGRPTRWSTARRPSRPLGRPKKRSEFWMANDGDGTVRGGFRLPEAQADQLLAAVRAMSAPRRDHLRDHPGATDDAGDSTYERDLDHRTRLGMGFAEVCSRIPGDLLSSRSGFGPTLMVHLDLKTLVDGIKAGTLSGGTRVSASQVRLMACTAGIIPQVFGGKSVPLDHGHEQRLFTKPQKQAMASRDRGCTAPGCDRPPEECEGHHWRTQWARGGTTTLDDGVLICPFHHRRAHDQDWQARLGPSGHIEWKLPGNTTWQHKPPTRCARGRYPQPLATLTQAQQESSALRRPARPDATAPTAT